MVIQLSRVNLALSCLLGLCPLATVAALAAGCSSDDKNEPKAKSADAGFEASDLCPPKEDKRVRYVSADPNACANITLECTGEQNGFDNACGCGCIDKGDPLCPPVVDPSITWISRDPAQCGDTKPSCPPGENAFLSSCGCGCTRPGE